MRMSELSERSGVPIASIKFYQREGLVPEGEKTSQTQTSYGEAHVARLRIVRALIEVGGLTVVSAKAVLGAIESDDLPLDWAFGIAQRAASKSISAVADEVSDESAATVDALLAEKGWSVLSANPGRAIVARVIETYRSLGQESMLSTLAPYADAAEIVAAADLAAIAARPDREAMVESVVIGTALGDPLFAGLRRLAQENASHSLFPAPPGANPDDCESDQE
jgi:DNA-binding transcriptional MerR regulator